MAGQGAGVEGAVLNVVAGVVLASDFASKLADNVDAAVGPAAEKAGKTFGEKLSKSFDKVGKSLSKSVTAPLVAAAGGALAAFLTVDEGLDKVRIQTGATGDALTGLEDAVKKVATSSTLGFGEAADVVSILYQRLGLTGAPLEALATQLGNLKQITGQAANAEAITDLFKTFAIPAEQQSKLLDQIFRASQASGVEFNKLTESVAANASKFKELGIPVEEAIALLAGIEKSGLSADTVLAGLSKSILKSTGSADEVAKIQGNLAKSEEALTTASEKLAVARQKLLELQADPKAKQSDILAVQAAISGLERDAASARATSDELSKSLSKATAGAASGAADFLTKTVDGIKQLLAAGDQAGANALAKETFGKGFVEVVAAIQSGAFDTTAFVASIQNGTDSIDSLAAATADFPESLNIAKKSLATAFAPMGDQIGQIIQQLATAVVPVIQHIADVFNSMPEGVQTLVVVLGAVAASAGPTLVAIGQIATGLTGLSKAFSTISTLLSANPWVIALAAVVAIAIVIYKNWDSISAALKAIFEMLGAVVTAVWDGIANGAKAAADIVVGALTAIVEFGKSVWNGLVGAARAAWDGITGAIRTVLEGIKTLIVNYVTVVYVAPFKMFVSAVSAIWNGITGAAKAAFDFVGRIISTAVAIYIGYWKLLGGVFTTVWDLLKRGAQGAYDFVVGIINRIKAAIDAVVNTIKDLPGKLASSLGGFASKLLPGRAEGGPVSAGEPYIVGERGPELYVPRSSGTIIPNNALASVGASAPNYQITIVNPVSEPASTSIPNALRKASYLRN